MTDIEKQQQQVYFCAVCDFNRDVNVVLAFTKGKKKLKRPRLPSLPPPPPRTPYWGRSCALGPCTRLRLLLSLSLSSAFLVSNRNTVRKGGGGGDEPPGTPSRTSAARRCTWLSTVLSGASQLYSPIHPHQLFPFFTNTPKLTS